LLVLFQTKVLCPYCLMGNFSGCVWWSRQTYPPRLPWCWTKLWEPNLLLLLFHNFSILETKFLLLPQSYASIWSPNSHWTRRWECNSFHKPFSTVVKNSWCMKSCIVQKRNKHTHCLKSSIHNIWKINGFFGSVHPWLLE